MIIINSRAIWQERDVPYRIRVQVADKLGLDIGTVGAVIAAYETAVEESARADMAEDEARRAEVANQE